MTTPTESTASAVTLPAQGERFRCEQCGMQVEIVSDCHCELGQPHFICCGRPLAPAGQSWLSETQDAFVEQMQKGMDKANETIAWLRDKAAQAQDASKEQWPNEVEMLSQQYHKLRESLGEVKDTSGDAWREVAQGLSESWQSFKAGCSRAITRYRSSPRREDNS